MNARANDAGGRLRVDLDECTRFPAVIRVRNEGDASLRVENDPRRGVDDACAVSAKTCASRSWCYMDE